MAKDVDRALVDVLVEHQGVLSRWLRFEPPPLLFKPKCVTNKIRQCSAKQATANGIHRVYHQFLSFFLV
jgi:hypothetical protein